MKNKDFREFMAIVRDVCSRVSCPKCGAKQGKFCDKKQRFNRWDYQYMPHAVRRQKYSRSLEIEKELERV